MDLIDKHIAVWVTSEQFKAIFSIDLGPSAGNEILVGGQILGFAPVGIWIQLVAVLGDDGELLPRLTQRGAIRLVRWECIVSAEIWEHKPDLPDIKRMGFHPR